MTVERLTLDAGGEVRSLNWTGDALIDWARGGTLVYMDGRVQYAGRLYAFGFDAAITAHDGRYAFIYKRFGTKGILLRDGEPVREVNRSYYFADAYEYPCCFITASDGRLYLAHCPNEYNQLELEDVETGLYVSGNRQPKDYFFSRLKAAPGGRHMLSCGWIWHPANVTLIIDVDAALRDAAALDDGFMLGGDVEVGSADFVDADTILIGTGADNQSGEYDEKLPTDHIALFDLKSKRILRKAKAPVGNLVVIDDRYAWDLFGHPRIIDTVTGAELYACESIDTCTQSSAIWRFAPPPPAMAYDRKGKRLAVANGNKIEILSL